MESQVVNEVKALYQRLLDGWNNRNARDMAQLFATDGEMIGFDGSLALGSEDIFSHLDSIFKDHPTARFISKVKNVHILNPQAAILRAIAGMVPPGKSDINPAVNTHHTIVAINRDGEWRIQLFQNTPAQFHGKPELVEQMSEELRQLI
ncbi:SgcJ/EcaC family oxidoreductase [Geobacillus sp. Y412MC52]|uniref:SgcJ/EcaC family oxidoreductase n=1 Tax=Geobacillus sp. (strain Y412MC52) TaxID=550542 RepID=UPI00018C0E4F|nr:SgcJ/EcaC family oxidoreductase [Geobacillus sp. Y412MC52]ADU92932.1 hypothetical protein GYMC52_0432 [Geobacillus sp. Y412MC52]